jgi:hypothetical protein
MVRGRAPRCGPLIEDCACSQTTHAISLLRPRHQRPHCRPTKPCNELPPSHRSCLRAAVRTAYRGPGHMGTGLHLAAGQLPASSFAARESLIGPSRRATSWAPAAAFRALRTWPTFVAQRSDAIDPKRPFVRNLELPPQGTQLGPSIVEKPGQ